MFQDEGIGKGLPGSGNLEKILPGSGNWGKILPGSGNLGEILPGIRDWDPLPPPLIVPRVFQFNLGNKIIVREIIRAYPYVIAKKHLAI